MKNFIIIQDYFIIIGKNYFIIKYEINRYIYALIKIVKNDVIIV